LVVDPFLEWVSGLPSPTIYATLVVLSAVENVFPPVPADVAVVLGAFLSHRGLTSAPLVGVLCWLANTASSAAVYLYARTHGRRFFEHGWGRRLVTPRMMRALGEAYSRHGTYGIFFSRFLPGLRAGVTPFAGVVGIAPARALVPSAAASALWYAFLVAAGAALGRNLEAAIGLINRANRVLALVTVVVVMLGAFWLWRHYRQRGEG
jgi:membrane protein DedA with SNARE-associated domain